jgi:hypothetical protein
MDMNQLTDDERMIAEQAVAAFQAVRAAGRGAQFGHGLTAMELVIHEKGKEVLRSMLELGASDHAESKKKAIAARRAPASTS